MKTVAALVVLLTLCSHTGACPTGCVCSNGDATCTGLTSFPSEGFEDYTKVTIESSTISTIPTDAFRGSNITEIQLNTVEVTDRIERCAFAASLTSLETIRIMTKSVIERIEKNAFAFDSVSTSILIEDITINHLDSYSFSGVRNIPTLAMTFIIFGDGALQPEVFRGLTVANTLMFSNNQADVIPERFFTGLIVQAGVLQFRTNTIGTFECGFMDGQDKSVMSTDSNNVKCDCRVSFMVTDTSLPSGITGGTSCTGETNVFLNQKSTSDLASVCTGMTEVTQCSVTTATMPTLTCEDDTTTSTTSSPTKSSSIVNLPTITSVLFSICMALLVYTA